MAVYWISPTRSRRVNERCTPQQFAIKKAVSNFRICMRGTTNVHGSVRQGALICEENRPDDILVNVHSLFAECPHCI